MEWLLVSTVSTSQGLPNYSISVVNERPAAPTVSPLAPIKVNTISLERFFHTAKRGIVAFQRYELLMGQGGCGVIVRIHLRLGATLKITVLLPLLWVGNLIMPFPSLHIVVQPKSTNHLLDCGHCWIP